MVYREYTPHSLLSDYVECYWSAYSSKPPFREKESLIPDGTIELMFNFGDNYFHILEDEPAEIKGSHVIGIRKAALSISQPGKQNFFCIRFRLGGIYPFFKLPGHLFAANIHTVQDLFGHQLRDLEEKLYHTTDNQTRVQITDQFLLQRLSFNDENYLFTRKCIPYLLRGHSIAQVAADLNTNYKKIERKFNQVLGVSPTELVKINRFNNALLTIYSCKLKSLTAVAYACGYYDQSHFIREFKQLTGFSPKAFLRQQFTIVQVIQPALADRLSNSYNF